jgi:hypothetical protein
MAFDLSQFLAKGLIYGGARPSKFDVQATLPSAIQGLIDPTSLERLTFTCKAASIPAFRLGTTEVPYFGRKIKLNGDRTWDTWRISVMNDEDYNCRAMFEAWNNSINALISNVMIPQEDSATVSGISNLTEENYKSDWLVTQYGKDGTVIRQYTLIGCWPSVVSEMALDWDNTNRVQEFGVAVEFDMMVPVLEGAKNNTTIYSDAV